MGPVGVHAEPQDHGSVGSSSRLLGTVGVHGGQRGSLCRDLGSWVAMAVGKGRFCWGPADHTCS